MWEFVLQPEVLKTLATVVGMIIVLFLGRRGHKYITYMRIVFKVWHFVEKAGALNDWVGYEKLAIAMGVLRDRFHSEFGRGPSANEEGWAVKVFTWLCNIEDKEDINDFLEG